jgi:hypothetical protein
MLSDFSDLWVTDDSLQKPDCHGFTGLRSTHGEKIFGFCSLPAVELLAWFRNKPKSVFAPWVLRIPVAPWQCGFYVFPNFLIRKTAA